MPRMCSDREILDMYAEGHNRKHICRVLHTGHHRVTKLIGPKPKRDRIEEKIEKLFRSGLSEKKICEALTISNVAVQKVVCRLLRELSEMAIAKIVQTHVNVGRKPAFVARNIRVDRSEVMRLFHLAEGTSEMKYFNIRSTEYTRCNCCGAKVIKPCLACQIRSR